MQIQFKNYNETTMKYVQEEKKVEAKKVNHAGEVIQAMTGFNMKLI